MRLFSVWVVSAVSVRVFRVSPDWNLLLSEMWKRCVCRCSLLLFSAPVFGFSAGEKMDVAHLSRTLCNLSRIRPVYSRILLSPLICPEASRESFSPFDACENLGRISGSLSLPPPCPWQLSHNERWHNKPAHGNASQLGSWVNRGRLGPPRVARAYLV